MRRRLFLAALGTIALSIALVLWGTIYKLSLYPGKLKTHITPAKVLSERERTERNDSAAEASCPVKAKAYPPLLLSLFALSIAALRIGLHLSGVVSQNSPSFRCRRIFAAALPHFGFRPPPLLV